jgi:hypothetical protein
MRFVILFLAVPCMAVTCGPGGGPPEPDVCASPAGGAIASLAIGPSDATFTPWAAEDEAIVTSGDQGGSMLGVRLRVAGAGACLAQHTRVLRAGNVIAEETSPLNAYEDEDGTRTTSSLWLVFNGATPQPGEVIEVVAEAGDRTVSARLTIVP